MLGYSFMDRSRPSHALRVFEAPALRPAEPSLALGANLTQFWLHPGAVHSVQSRTGAIGCSDLAYAQGNIEHIQMHVTHCTQHWTRVQFCFILCSRRYVQRNQCTDPLCSVLLITPTHVHASYHHRTCVFVVIIQQPCDYVCG